jgi:hypothetical protein
MYLLFVVKKTTKRGKQVGGETMVEKNKPWTN